MVICPKCNIKYQKGKEYCKKCGSYLMAEQEPFSGPEENVSNLGEIGKATLICPKCKEFYRIGNYCRTCGSLLLQRSKFQRIDMQPLGKKEAKRISREWRNLLREKKKLEICTSKLEAQQDRVSKEVFESISARYQDRLESLSLQHQEMGAELESMRNRASDKIHLFEIELEPLQKRLEEYHSLYESGAMAKRDFFREKKRDGREMRLKERSLRQYRQILSLLPSPMEVETPPVSVARNLLQPLPLMIACGIVVVMVAGGYLLWPVDSQSSKGASKESVTSSSPMPSAEDQEVEKIKTLFESIRQANLQKNIDLFMSCYSRDFKDWKEKQASTLETWKHFHYHQLSYHLKTKTIVGSTAHIRVEWLAKISQKTGGHPQESRALLDVTLRKEDAFWKIKEIKPVT
jgi:hypothetical protein